MKEFFESATHCFWHFVGYALILATIVRLISYLMTRLYRVMTIVFRGYPPAHLDADGDSVDMIRAKYEYKAKKQRLKNGLTP